MDNSQSFFTKAYNPILQAAVIFAAVVFITLMGKLVQLLGIMEVHPRFPWMTSGAFMLFFAMFNSIFFLSSDNMLKYWGRSIYSYVGLAAASSLLAYLASSIPLNEAGSFRWIYIVLTIGYLIFLSIMVVMKNIVDFAQREEWNHPRLRKGKKKR